MGPCSPDPLESVLFWDKGEVFSPVSVGSWGIKPSFILFFCFIRRFWNQIFTCKRKGMRGRSINCGNLRTLFGLGLLSKAHLGLVKLQRSGDLNSPSSCQIFVEVEFFFKFRQLLCRKVGPPGVVNPPTLPAEVAVRFRSWKKRRELFFCDISCSGKCQIFL